MKYYPYSDLKFSRNHKNHLKINSIDSTATLINGNPPQSLHNWDSWQVESQFEDVS